MKWKLLPLTAMVIGIAGCGAFGPERDPPPMPSPEHYAAATQQTTWAAGDGLTQHAVVGARPVAQWWKAYESEALDALVDEGLKNAPSLAAAQNTLKAAREGLRAQIGQSLYPSIDVGFDPSRQKALVQPNFPPPTYQYNVFAAQVQSAYTFDFFGAAVLADRSLAHQIDQQAYQLDALRRALATNIVVATVNAASLRAQVAATEELVAVGEERARQIAARYRLGSATRDDMLTAEQDAANAAATLPALRAQALAVRHAQALLLGRTPDQAPEALPLEALHLPETVPVSVASDLLHQRPDILAAEAALRAAADQAGAATASLFPSLTLSAAYGHGGFDWSSFTSPAGAIWSVSASLTQPLFHGGALVARRHQYQAAYDAAVAQYRQTVLSAFQNVADTLVSLEQDADAVTQTRRAAAAARDMHENTQARYKLGSSPLFATLTARQQYENAAVLYIRAQAARMADTAALFESMGEPPVETPARLASRAR